MATLPPTYPPQPPQPLYQPPLRQAVVITDIDMPFGSMVRFILKWCLASIPALILLWIVLGAVTLAIAGLFGGFVHGLFPTPPSHPF